MKTVFVLFDTLNRRSLGCYGGNTVQTPNFDRLARRSVAFDSHWVGSLPCMPARREMMTGRHNFLHRSWGPLEPFDRAFPELLGTRKGVYCHLVTDHAHYWEDGGATYHTRYDSAELVRGQEADAWKGIVAPDAADWSARYHPSQYSIARRHKNRRNMANREAVRSADDYPAAQTFSGGLEFLERNREADNWFLQIETFDPHEPFDAPASYRAAYPTDYRGPILDYPNYGPVKETPEEVAELRANYAATLAHCDHQLGRLLDFFDAHDLWQDTVLVLSTDHGFLLGEHEMWGKVIMPVYNEVAHIPLMIWHPAHAARAGERRTALTQTIDLMPTFLELFGIEAPAETQGHSLLPLLADPAARTRDAGLYGQHGSAVNITDGRYAYFRYPKNMHGGNLNQYTLMPTHIQSLFSVEELRDASLAQPFDFTQGVRVLKVPSTEKSPVYRRHGAGAQIDTETRLFDLAADPDQLHPIHDPAVEERLCVRIVELMQATDAPPEAYQRFDLEKYLPAAHAAGAREPS
jgi:arylsulfatase A-like enzyme